MGTSAQAAGVRLTVILCEGERKVDVANRAIRREGRPHVIAVGTMTGCRGLPCDDSLRPLLGCAVQVWPDADAPEPGFPRGKGFAHMQGIAARLVALGGPAPAWITWPDAPAKGDIADYLLAGGTIAGIAAMVTPSASGEPKGPAEPQPAAPGKLVRRWPAPLDKAAYHGVLGKIAREMEPHIEADSSALLVNLVVAAGVALGRGARTWRSDVALGRGSHVQVGAKPHYAILYAVDVGQSGDNKGDAWWPIETLLQQVMRGSDGLPVRPHTTDGLSTGEGLLWQMRDERRETRPARNGKPAEEAVVDVGVADKRLLAFEAEFARVLATMYREGSTLSMTLRNLYDGAQVARSSPKGNPITATGVHFGLIAQITPEELRRKLHEVELFNGFGNRFLWVLTRRIHSRPNPPPYTPEKAKSHARR
jgi:hypothetical protein